MLEKESKTEAERNVSKIDKIREGLKRNDSSWAKRANLLIEARKKLDEEGTLTTSEALSSVCDLPVLESHVLGGGWLICSKL